MSGGAVAVVREQHPVRNGMALTNFAMRRVLDDSLRFRNVPILDGSDTGCRRREGAG